MYRARILRIPFILLLTLNISISFAQETSPTTTYSLGEVVVSGQQVGTQINTTLEISSDDIEKKNIKTLDKALELLPGVDVRTASAGKPRVNIRGFRSRHTILLLNGIPINSTWDQQFDPHLIPTENISKIKLSYGTHSVLYGQGGLAGVINIITKQGIKNLHIDTSTDIDERGNHYGKANMSGGNDRVNFFTGISQNHSDGFLLSDDFMATGNENGGVRENSDDKRFSFFGNIGFEMNDAVELGLTIDHSNGEFGIPPNTITDKNDPFYKKAKYDRIDDFETFSSQASVSYAPGGMIDMRAWAFINSYQEDHNRYDDNDYNYMTKKNSYSDKIDSTSKGGTLQTNFHFESSGDLSLSFSGQKDEYTSDLNIVEKNNDPAKAYHNNYDLRLYSAAFEYKKNLISSLDIVAGYSHHWQQKDIGNDDDKASYMLGASYKATDTTKLRASFAHKIRFPSISQLYDSDSGDSSLKPEISDNYEAGITQQLPWDMVLDLNIFSSNVEDYIEKDDITDKSANNEEYAFKGFEVRLTKPIFENGHIGISYSFLDTEDKSTNTQKDELQYRPKDKFVIDASYTFDIGLTASADVTYTGEQYHYNNSGQKGELSDFSIFNLKLEQKLYKKNLSIYVGADNLFDENYSESYGIPRSGRTAYAGARIKF